MTGSNVDFKSAEIFSQNSIKQSKLTLDACLVNSTHSHSGVRETARSLIKSTLTESILKDDTQLHEKTYAVLVKNLNNSDGDIRDEAIKTIQDLGMENSPLVKEKIFEAALLNLSIPYSYLSPSAMRQIIKYGKENDPRVRAIQISNINSADLHLSLEAINYLLDRDEKDHELITKIKLKLANNANYTSSMFTQKDTYHLIMFKLKDKELLHQLFTKDLKSIYPSVRQTAAIYCFIERVYTEDAQNALKKNINPKHDAYTNIDAIESLLPSGDTTLISINSLSAQAFLVLSKALTQSQYSVDQRLRYLNLLNEIFYRVHEISDYAKCFFETLTILQNDLTSEISSKANDLIKKYKYNAETHKHAPTSGAGDYYLNSLNKGDDKKRITDLQEAKLILENRDKYFAGTLAHTFFGSDSKKIDLQNVNDNPSDKLKLTAKQGII
jgi:hypothetical protein